MSLFLASMQKGGCGATLAGQRLRDVCRKMSDHNPVGLGCQEPSPPGRKHMQVDTKRSGSREMERGHCELHSSGEGKVGERPETEPRESEPQQKCWPWCSVPITTGAAEDPAHCFSRKMEGMSTWERRASAQRRKQWPVFCDARPLSQSISHSFIT